MKKLPILLICLIAIGFFLFRTMANKSNHVASVPVSKKEIVASKSLAVASTSLPVMPAVKTIERDRYYDKVAKITNTIVANDSYSFQRVIQNPLFPNMFKSHSEMSGFYGPDHYKIDLFIKKSESKTSDKSYIMIEGLSKYKKNIRKMTGYFEVLKVAVNHYQKSDPLYFTNFIISGDFHFEENKDKQQVGTYEGTWVMDLSEVNNPYKELEFASVERGISDGNNLVLHGTWHNENSDETKQVCFSETIEKLGADIFKAFTYGDREISIKDEYASKGWTTYYENEEWWSVNK